MAKRIFSYKNVDFSFRSYHSGTAILFLHGFLENQNMWKGVIEKLPRAYRKISLDLPGHGESGNLGYIHTMEEMAEVVKGLVDKLKLKRFFLCGHSMGGYVALAFAEKYPEMVKGLILQNSSARADWPQKKKDRLRAIKIVKQSHTTFIRGAIPHLFRPKNRRNMRDMVNLQKAEALKTSKQGVIAALEGMRIRPDREVLLHFAPYNILFVASENDPVLPWEELKEQLNGAKVTPCITENGHMSHIEDFDVLIAAFKNYLKENN